MEVVVLLCAGIIVSGVVVFFFMRMRADALLAKAAATAQAESARLSERLSAMTVKAYEECASAENEIAREAALKRHIESVRGHLKGLSAKQYQTLYGIESLDFVLMFVAVEPAFMLAVTNDRELFKEAWERNVILVSPSTLMFVLRTVSHLWRQEQQTRNTQEIARRGAELYDKLCGFVGDLEDVGRRIGQAQESFDGARAKLVGGRGNVIRQAEMLKVLGVKPTKQLPAPMVEESEEALSVEGDALSPS